MEVKCCTMLEKSWIFEDFKTVVSGNPNEDKYMAKFYKGGNVVLEKELISTPRKIDYDGYAFHRKCVQIFG